MSAGNGRRRNAARSRSVPMRKADLEREAEALELKLGGASYRRIAAVQGCEVSTAHRRVERALAHTVPQERADELRKIQNERLEAGVGVVLQTLSRDALGPETVVQLTGALVRLSERSAKLNGLDRPVEINLRTRTDAELERLLDELAGNDPAPERAEVDAT